MGGIGAVAEPLVVIFLLFGGTWLNRNVAGSRRGGGGSDSRSSSSSDRGGGAGRLLDVEGQTRLGSPLRGGGGGGNGGGTDAPERAWRERTIGVWRFKKRVTTPDTRRFKDYLLSRLLARFPFLVECWYWALIYWVYQLGRAATAVYIVEGTIHIARRHALKIIAWEQSLHIFYELPIQHFFLGHPFVLRWINRTYSYIHIPGSIAFLVWLFYYTHTVHRYETSRVTPVGPKLFQARRRTMALCNLLAFIIFTAWPCMPPRLLSMPNATGPEAQLGKTYGFVDTVHGPGGDGSIWTDNKFTNKFAAMPSMHFGYSLLIGLTIATIPLAGGDATSSRSRSRSPLGNGYGAHHDLASTSAGMSRKRMICLAVGTFYPTLILVAIVATANHFILDALAGATVCGIAWWGNGFMLNLCALEDWFLWLVRIHKPGQEEVWEEAARLEEEKGSWLH